MGAAMLRTGLPSTYTPQDPEAPRGAREQSTLWGTGCSLLPFPPFSPRVHLLKIQETVLSHSHLETENEMQTMMSGKHRAMYIHSAGDSPARPSLVRESLQGGL